MAVSCRRQEKSVQVSLEVWDSVTLDAIDEATVSSSGRVLDAHKADNGRYILTLLESDTVTTFTVKAPDYKSTSISWAELTDRSEISIEGLPVSRIALRPIKDNSHNEYVLDEMASPGSYDFDNVSDATKESEQDGTGQPATRPESKSEGGDKPQPEAEGRSR
jgi:hypothetical protein